MSLQIGQQLVSYEITSLLGKGGMGQVDRASDTKLKREVAIKILPEESCHLGRFSNFSSSIPRPAFAKKLRRRHPKIHSSSPAQTPVTVLASTGTWERVL